MPYSTPEQLRFPPLAGYTVRADFEGGALSSDFGALLLRGIDRQIGLTERLAAAVRDKRHPSYIDHPSVTSSPSVSIKSPPGMRTAMMPIVSGTIPCLSSASSGRPLIQTRTWPVRPTFSRLEHSVNRTDLYRLTQAFVDHFIASYPEPPAAIVLDLDHSDDPTHGQQELTFYNHHYQSHCYLPLFIFEGTSHALVDGLPPPGKRPPGAENAMILVRLLAYLRRHWPLHPYPGPRRQSFRHPGSDRGDRASAPDRFRLRLGRQSGLAPPRGPRHAGGTRALPAADRPRAGLWRAPSRQQPRV